MNIPEKEDDNSKENGYPLLSGIDSPDDLRHLNPAQLPDLCKEIRQFLIENLSINPGHFASSMGAVEIIVALHYVFNTPEDRIVFDVGHQAYAHKLLTGRRNEFKNQRKLNGISGFPNPSESKYDTFVSGHAGNSISAALGMSIADHNSEDNSHRKTVALIGDASISGGLAFEGLNNASNNPNNLLIILNDNDMSINDNVGALHHYLTDITTSAGYNKLRYKTSNLFHRLGILSERNKKRILRLNNSLKAFISRQQNIFEGLDIRYFGPADGHDVIKLVKILSELKEMHGPRLLHISTVKGKGYPVAEQNPSIWHAPGKFNPVTGERIKSNDESQPPLWQEIFGNTLVELAEKNPRITGITAAMPDGTSISKMLEKFPTRTFDVGISEGHAVTFAGGLAAAGQIPFVAIYSSFLQRALDNIIHDVAIQGLHVVFCIDRAGIVGEDGVTHHGVFDMVYLRMIPGMIIAAPSDEETFRNLLFTASSVNAPVAIRYPRGRAYNSDWKKEIKPITIGKGRTVVYSPDADIAILSIGTTLHNVMKAVEILKSKNINVNVYDFIWLKPLDSELLAEIARNNKHIITIEDGARNGGFGSAVTDWINENGLNIKVKKLGIPDNWVAHGTIEQLQRQCGYSIEDIVNEVMNHSSGQCM